MSNKFAIILPTVRCGIQLFNAIESVFQQSYQDYLLIVSYETEALFLKYSGLMAKDRNATRLLQITRGNEAPANDSGATARNYAIGFVPTNCNWICYIDDDDEWYPNRLQNVNDWIEENNYGNLGAFYTYADLFKWKHKSPRSSEKVLKQIGIINNVTCGGMFHTPEAFKKTKGWNPNNTEDHDRELYEEMCWHVSHNVLEVPTFKFIWS